MARRDLLVVLVVVVAFGLISQRRGCAPRPLAPPPLPDARAEGAAAPGFVLPGVDGARHALADHAGKVVFLNFWATWCPPCREELPVLQQLHETLAGEGLHVLAVSVDTTSTESVASFVARHGVDFSVLHDADSEIARSYGVRAYPTSVLIDRRGRVAYRLASAWDWTDPAALAWLRTLLAEPGDP